MNNSRVNHNNSMNPNGTTRNRRRVSSNEATTKAGTVETVTLPPCRICGAKASGFHYGVNSCEACKGFFRRALKRPAMFCCSKNGACDVMGNKRSTCRFCRYKLCLHLGMCRESIKTGRYSHKKRTRDTIEVKRLQSSPNSIARNTELDILVKNLLETHDSLAISSSHMPQHFYRRQLDYFNSCLLNKKSSNNSYVNFKTKDNPVFGHHEFKHYCQGNDNCEPRDHIKLSSPSPTSSRLSSDSGFIEENDELMSNNNNNNNPALLSDACEYVQFIDFNKDNSNKNETSIILNNSGFDIQTLNKSEPGLCFVDSRQNSKLKYDYFLHNDVQTGKSQENNPKLCSLESFGRNPELHQESKEKVCGRAKLSDFNICLGTTGNTRASGCRMEQTPPSDTNNQSDELHQRNCAFKICSVHKNWKYAMKTSNFERTPLADNSELKTREKCENITSNRSHLQQTISHPAGFRHDNKLAQENEEHILQAMSSRIQFSSAESINSSYKSISKSGFNFSTNTVLACTLDNFRHIPRNEYMFCKESSYKAAKQESDFSLTSDRKSFSSVRAVTKFSEMQDNDELTKYLDQRKESKYASFRRAHDWINGYIKFAKAIPGFRSLAVEDQKQLLKHAWDEVWLLSTYRNYNSELCVVATPGGKCFRLDELESIWGKRYSETAFKISDVLKGQNLSHELVTLLKAVCIVSPDRCPLNNQTAVEEIYWTMVSCLMRLIETSTPFSRMMFPRLVSILISLRDLSESARGVSERDCSVLDRDGLFESFLPF